MPDTPKETIEQRFEMITESTKKRSTQSVEFRLKQLRKLNETLDKYEKEICEAKRKDLGMSETDSFFTAIVNIKLGKSGLGHQGGVLRECWD